MAHGDLDDSLSVGSMKQGYIGGHPFLSFEWKVARLLFVLASIIRRCEKNAGGRIGSATSSAESPSSFSICDNADCCCASHIHDMRQPDLHEADSHHLCGGFILGGIAHART